MKSIFHLVAISRRFAAISMFALTACGGGETDEAQTSEGTSSSAPFTIVASSDKRYAALKAASGAQLEVFRKADGAIDQTLYSNPQAGERVRVFFDTEGLPQRLVDVDRSTTVIIDRVSPERTDFRTYAASGNFVSGYAVLSRGGSVAYAPITGAPSFTGQLSGQIVTPAATGSFSILPANDAGLGAPVPLTTAQLALVDALTGPNGTARKSVLDPFSKGAQMQAIAGIDGRAVLGGLVAGVVVGGATTVGAGLIAGAMAAYGLQNYLLPIIDAVRGSDSLEQMHERLNPFLEGFHRGSSAESSTQAALAGGGPTTLRGALSRALDVARDLVGTVIDRSTLPTLQGGPPSVATDVSGVGVDQRGASYRYDGSISAGGAVSLTGTAADGGQGIAATGRLVNGVLNGTVSGRLGNGSLSGRVGSLGLCAQLQQSGGQGTFSYAFDAAATSGSLVFYRNAFSIPDGFRVTSNGATLYDSGGLVSGSATVSLQLNGSRVLFVTVNAPNSGTAWELSLGCPS